MISKRIYVVYDERHRRLDHGIETWYLFGMIPLYTRQTSASKLIKRVK